LNSFSWERSVWISELDKLFNSGKEDGIDPGSEDGDPGINEEEEEEEEEGEGEKGLKVVEEEEEEDEVNGFVYEVPKEEGGTELLVGMDDDLESEGEGEGDGEKKVGEGVDADVESER